MMNTKTQTNFIAADTNSILRRHLPPALFETNARRLNRCRNNSFLMKKHSDTLQCAALKFAFSPILKQPTFYCSSTTGKILIYCFRQKI